MASVVSPRPPPHPPAPASSLGATPSPPLWLGRQQLDLVERVLRAHDECQTISCEDIDRILSNECWMNSAGKPWSTSQDGCVVGRILLRNGRWPRSKDPRVARMCASLGTLSTTVTTSYSDPASSPPAEYEQLTPPRVAGDAAEFEVLRPDSKRQLSLETVTPAALSEDVGVAPAGPACGGLSSVARTRPASSTAASGAATPSKVTHGITMKCAQWTWAILHGWKTIENRHFRLSPGWYALHTGQGKLTPEARAKLGRLIPTGLPSEASLPHGAISGLVRMDGVARLDDCATSRSKDWATGPVCNVVGAVVRLRTPVGHKGGLSVWRLSGEARAAIAAQLQPPAAGRMATRRDAEMAEQEAEQEAAA